MTIVLVAILAALLGAGAGLYVGRRTGWFGAIASIFAPSTPEAAQASIARNPEVTRAVARAASEARVAAGQMLRVLP